MNKKIKINDRTSNFNMSSLQGYVKTTYAHLVEKLGEPETDFDKSTAHWTLEAPDGTVATIYDYKEYTTPLGEYYWHVGGHNRTKALLLVEIATDVIPVTEQARQWNPYGGGRD
jgi:hypothetical protein